MSSVKLRPIKQADQSTGKLHGHAAPQAIDRGLPRSFLARQHPPRPGAQRRRAVPSLPAAAQQMLLSLSLGKASSTAEQLGGDI